VNAELRRSLIAALVLVAACSRGDSGEAVLRRDSVGIAIVENRTAGRDFELDWRISDEPFVEIGRVDAPEEYQLFRAAAAVRLEGGRIVVANGGTNELRFYDSEGRFLFVTGREGEGPGEFRDLQGVWRMAGDSLLAYDFMPARLSVLTSSGEFVRSFVIRSPEGRQVIVEAALPDGSLVVSGAPIWTLAGTEGVVRDSVPLYRYDREGGFIGRVGLFPTAEVLRVGTEAGVRMTTLPFSRIPLTAVTSRLVVFGPAESYELQFYDTAGALKRVVRLDRDERRVAQRDIDKFRRDRLAAAEETGTRPLMERMLRAMPIPDVFPPYQRLLIDTEEYIWVADYRATEEEDWRWRVFAPDGVYQGHLIVPNVLELWEVGADYVLGLWLDELETESIRVYALDRPDGT
jgi:hypothetical protein